MTNNTFIYEQSISTWSDYLKFIPYLIETRSKNTIPFINRCINETIILFSFAAVDGFVWNFMESSMYHLLGDHNLPNEKIDKYNDLVSKKSYMEFDDKIKFCIDELNISNIKSFKEWEHMCTLKNLRNTLAHGGTISIKYDYQKSYYTFTKELFETVLIKTQQKKRNELNKLTESNYSHTFNLITSNITADFYNVKSIKFLTELNSKHLNIPYKNFCLEHYLK